MAFVAVRLLLLATGATLPVTFYADDKDVVLIAQVPWLDWTHVIALAFMVGAIWEIATLRWSLYSRPKFIVVARIEPDDQEGAEAGYLSVYNAREACQIQAWGQIIGGKLENPRRRSPWPIPWRDLAGHPVPIEKGNTLILGIQAQMLHHPKQYSSGSEVEPEYKYLLKFERFGGVGDSGLVHETTGWSPTEESTKCFIRVTLTSTPSVAGKVLSRDYEVGLTKDGELIWNPVPTPHI